MSVTIPAWAIPIAFTVLIWGIGILKPVPPSQGDYDFGPAFTSAVRLALCIIGTLSVWLFYFMARSLA